MTSEAGRPTDLGPVFPGLSVRERLISALRLDLLGPEAPDELLPQSPATRYLVGMLAPQNTEVDPVEDEQNVEAPDDSEGSADPQETPPPMSLSLAPSSIGISFVVADGTANLTATASWGDYASVDAPEGADSPDADAEEPASEKKSRKRQVKYWQRTPREAPVNIDPSKSGRSAPVSVGDGVHVEWIVRPVGNKLVISVFLVNARVAPPDKRPPDHLWLYQPRLEIGGDGAPFEAREQERDWADAEPDVASADLVYRARREFATGHGVATGWRPAADPSRADSIWTETVPEHGVPIVSAAGVAGIELEMDQLAAAASPADVQARLMPLLDAYERWIADREAECRSLPKRHKPVGQDHVKAMRRSLARMRGGLAAIASDSSVFEAFKFANRAVAMQRRASVRVLALRQGNAPPQGVDARWRPFQIAFILQCIAGIADPTHIDRDMADLLWFPTGGGKTEAYLGLTAFTIAHRRLRAATRGAPAGVSVLMRYTLRLLTIQQFQRATALICACETLRRSDPRWGTARFSIGLWVGGDVTPNSYEDSKEALVKLRHGERVFKGSPAQVLFCPWCGVDIPTTSYRSDDEVERTIVKCPSSTCDFGGASEGLPVLLVDEEIYRHPPSLLLATVDKFAQMPWNGRVQALFGRVDRSCPRHGFLTPGDQHSKQHLPTKSSPKSEIGPAANLAPPDLIIQDELHLISGPLGTLVGIYETAVDGLSMDSGGHRPKVVASTATIRRASEQITGIFARESTVFPPQGLDSDDSFFARRDEVQPGRRYLGVFAPGKSVKTSLVRVYAAMLSRAWAEFTRDPSEETDAYMTLVGYFNSLRELGGALRLVDDDVRSRLRVLQKRGYGPNRLIYEKTELTSRARTHEIAATLKALDRTFLSKKAGQYPIDVLLASNMLSVGVDINRLGLMVVSAQPKTSAEYIQATSRVGRVYPGLVIEVYNWVRPRDTSHYERFGHYHDTFYRHVEATSVTPFSARARDRALPAVLTGYARLGDPLLAANQSANLFSDSSPETERIIKDVADRAYAVTGRDAVRSETTQQLKNLASDWQKSTSPPSSRPLVYTQYGLKATDDSKAVLLRRMEQSSGRGMWRAAGSLREVEPEIPVVLLDDSAEGAE